MAIPVPVAELIFAEHCYRPITGSVGFLARQTTFLTPESLAYLGKKYGVRPPEGLKIEHDRETSAGLQNPELVTDRTLLRYLGINEFSFIDVSDYEGADVVLDLSQPIPAEMRGRFDFIYDGSCMDNIFNAGEALRNISRLLRPGGRAVLLEHATHMLGSYTVFSPAWFYDYFCANGYRDCKVYLGLFPNERDLLYGPWQLFYLNAATNSFGAVPQLAAGIQAMLVVIVEKGADSTDDVLPVQGGYRDPNSNLAGIMEKNQKQILASPRPFHGLSPHPTDADGWYPRLANLAPESIFVEHLAARVPARKTVSYRIDREFKRLRRFEWLAKLQNPRRERPIRPPVEQVKRPDDNRWIVNDRWVN